MPGLNDIDPQGELVRRIMALEAETRALRRRPADPVPPVKPVHLIGSSAGQATVNGGWNFWGSTAYDGHYSPLLVREEGFTEYRMNHSFVISATNGATVGNVQVGFQEFNIANHAWGPVFGFTPAVGSTQYDTGWLAIPSAVLNATYGGPLLYLYNTAGGPFTLWLQTVSIWVR